MTEVKKSVVEVIANRIRSNSQPNEREDNKKVALIVQGGAMRGVVGGGMGTALEQLIGSSNPFDVMYGTSAGAYTECYVQARQAKLGTSVYYEDLIRDIFINPKNFIRGKPVVNMYPLAEVIRDKKRLNAELIVNSPTPIHIYATNVKDGGGMISILSKIAKMCILL